MPIDCNIGFEGSVPAIRRPNMIGSVGNFNRAV